MELLHYTSLIIKPKRIRRFFPEEDQESLSNSISEFGLFHAIVVEKDGKTLVAGERRFRAMKHLWENDTLFNYNGEEVKKHFLPVVNLIELTMKKYREAELEENINRINLRWREKASAVAELHNLRVEESLVKGETHTKLATAEELHSLNPEETRTTSTVLQDVEKDLLVSTYSDDEEVQKARTRDEAIKIIYKKLDQAHKEALAREFEVSKLSTPHNLIQGDLFEELPKIDDETFSCIIADPPYGINADVFNNQAADKHTYVDTPDYSNAVCIAIAKEGYRIATKKAHLYLFCDINRFTLMKRLVSEEGWDVWNTPLIWYRGPTSGIAPKPFHGPRRTYETILFANKDNRRINSIKPDCITDCPHIGEVARASSKPVELYKYLIDQTCLPGDLVLDPCCGSGPIFPAAHFHKVVAWGIEFDRHGAGIAASRIRELNK